VQRAVSLAMARLLGVHTDGTQPHQPRALLDARRITCSSADSHSLVMWQRDHRRAAKRVSEAFKPGRDLASDRRAPTFLPEDQLDLGVRQLAFEVTL
jgi:hypothetical protein